MSQRIQKLEIGNHILAVYNSQHEKFKDAFEFLKNGLFRNEVAMLITEEITKDEVINILENNYGILNIRELISKGDFIIKSTSEWYFPDGIASTQRTKALWAELLNILSKRGKAGLRVVGDMSAFFKYGLKKQLLEYEMSLEQKFDFPLTGLCAYNKKDLDQFLTSDEISRIEEHHYPIWK